MLTKRFFSISLLVILLVALVPTSLTALAPQAGTIIVEKQTDPDGAPDSFTFTGNAAGTIGDGGQIVVSDLQPGTYTSVEIVPAGWQLTAIQCDDDNSSGNVANFTATFQLEEGETVKCTFFNLLPLDYGDAPDSYGTLLASNGARHAIIQGHSLGPIVDAEPDGQPSPQADGDDLNPPGAPDDEDGVTLPPLLTAGAPALVTVDGGPSGGMLDAWIDFNANGVFDHPAEHLWGGASVPLPIGPSPPLPFPVPPDAVPGPTYARFRLSNNGVLPPTGFAPDGEVEDYLVEIEGPPPEELEYGDAPDSYSTLLASNGARHPVVPGHSLGPIVDVEPDGQPSPQADGDDLNPPGAPDDEDGVTLPPLLTPGIPGVVTVDGGPSGGMLDAWIDFNANGVFDDPAEHLWGGVSLPLGIGPNPPFTFPVPLTAVPGLTYARFRLSINGGLSPVGPAPDGEVEDYLVTIRVPTAVHLHSFDASPAPAVGLPVGSIAAISGLALAAAAWLRRRR
ncbi:MAG: GEVED domain-containing protein [Chloroflexota bacterium]|nr:GEVED domain-containing protein [Chloroflexota bacterium]